MQVLWNLAAISLLFAFSSPPAVRGQAGAHIPRITREIQDASRALQARNALRFLSFFDAERFEHYSKLETNVVALTRQADIASSIEIGNWTQDDGRYRATIDWILRLTLVGAVGRVETRQELVRVEVSKINGKWKIVNLEPVDFFRPL